MAVATYCMKVRCKPSLKENPALGLTKVLVINSNLRADGQAVKTNFEWLAFYDTTKVWAEVDSSDRAAVTEESQFIMVMSSSSINSRKRLGHIF